MTHFKKILLTTDFSESAQAAVPFAVDLARLFGGSIDLVHVFEDSIVVAGLPGDPAMATDWINAARMERKVRLLDLAGKIAKSEKISVNPLFVEGPAANEILKLAESSRADCIVIATHGRTGLSHLIFGSVAERVVRMAHCPVLTIRPPAMKQPM